MNRLRVTFKQEMNKLRVTLRHYVQLTRSASVGWVMEALELVDVVVVVESKEDVVPIEDPKLGPLA